MKKKKFVLVGLLVLLCWFAFAQEQEMNTLATSPRVYKTVSAGWIGLICFWVIALTSGAYKLFNTRTLWLGFLPFTIFMVYWYFGLGFISTLVMIPAGTTLTNNPFANLLENLYYTFIFSIFILSFKA